MAQGLIAQARCNGQREVCRTPVAGLLVPGPINANLRLLERMSVTGPVRATQRLSMAAGYLSKHARGPSPSSQHTPGLRSMRRNGRPPECPQSQLSAGSRLESRIPQSAPHGHPRTPRKPTSTPHHYDTLPLFLPRHITFSQKENHCARPASMRVLVPNRSSKRVSEGFLGGKDACKKVTFDGFHVRIHPQRPSGCSWASCPTFKVAARGVQTSFRSCVQRDGRSKPKKARLGLGAGEVPWPLSVPTD